MSDCAVTAILRNFSSSSNNGKWKLSVDELARRFAYFFDPLFYANGNCEENEGYLSVIFRNNLEPVASKIFEQNEIRCQVSVVDVAGNKRITQSAVYFRDKSTSHDTKNKFHFGLERYLKREILLNDPPELLPEDCLTICVELDYINLFSIANYDRAETPFCTEDGDPYCTSEGVRLYISMDTDFGRQLCGLSDYFRRATDNSMIEGRTRKVHIPDEELDSFHLIFSIIFKRTEELILESMGDICRLYVVADKYDIQSVIEICRQHIKAFFCTTDDPKVWEHTTESVPAIMKLAETYRDGELEEDVQTYIYSKNKFETNDYALGKQLKEKLSTEWKCTNEEYYFRMNRIAKPELEFYQ